MNTKSNPNSIDIELTAEDISTVNYLIKEITQRSLNWATAIEQSLLENDKEKALDITRQYISNLQVTLVTPISIET